MIELDRKLFELCKPEGVQLCDGPEEPVMDDGEVCTGFILSNYKRHWSPSTQWADLEPLIEKACGTDKVFHCGFRTDTGWDVKFREIMSSKLLGQSYGRTLPEAAARALIELLETNK